MKGSAMHGLEQRASLDTQTRTHPDKKYLQNKGLCALMYLRVKAYWQSVCLSQYVGHTLYFIQCSCDTPLLISLAAFFPFLSQPVRFPISSSFSLILLPFSLIHKGQSINFHSSLSPRQCHRSKKPQTDKRTKKIIDLMSVSIRGKGGEGQHGEIKEREERDWKWTVGITQVKLMKMCKNTNVGWWRNV